MIVIIRSNTFVKTARRASNSPGMPVLSLMSYLSQNTILHSTLSCSPDTDPSLTARTGNLIRDEWEIPFELHVLSKIEAGFLTEQLFIEIPRSLNILDNDEWTNEFQYCRHSITYTQKMPGF
jgi:hypothetical protein